MKNDGGPAFPSMAWTMPNPFTHTQGFQSTLQPVDGMKLRDWFAAQALQAALSVGLKMPDTVAKLSYEYADAMLAERAKDGVRSGPDSNEA